MATDNQIRVRNARPDDIEHLVDLHYRCFSTKEHLATLLGRSFIWHVYRWFVTSEKTIVLVGEATHENGTIIGYNTVCNGPYHRIMISQNKGAAFRSLVLRPWLILHPAILRRVFRLNLSNEDLEKTLIHDPDIAHWGMICVEPSYRRCGIGFEIAARTIEECRQRGWNKMRVVIYHKNHSAREVLLKLGFVELPFSDKQKRAFGLNIPGQRSVADPS
jgi:GNAT superfamily N-acetyltransferase